MAGNVEVDKQSSNYEVLIWTPLIGFDMDKEDRGVDEYYSELGFTPSKISLFLFAPDIIHLHSGMAKEEMLRPDYCNYYGNIRNEKRAIQPWTNHKLRELVSNIKARGTEVYAGVMGVYFDDDHDSPYFYNSSFTEWLDDHKELLTVRTDGADCINVLKRFKDGTYYEDFLLKKLDVMLQDYGFSGIQAADGFCPVTGNASIFKSDYSDDMIDQFVQYTGINLPQSITAHVDDLDGAGLEQRASYIWNRLRKEWIDVGGFLEEDKRWTAQDGQENTCKQRMVQ